MKDGEAPKDKVTAIGRTLLFSGLTSGQLEELASHASERRLWKGEVLFVAGEEARGLFVVVQGAIRAFRGSGGREQVIHVEHTGATIGEMAVFDDGPYPATAAADEDSTVLFIGKHDFQQFLLNHPQVALSALKLLARRLRCHAELVESLSLREVGPRLARYLLAEARASGFRSGRGLQVELGLSNQQIAARVGTVREVVSRALSRLQQEGLVELDGRSLTIPDELSLEAFCQDC
ncbi:MAG: Crp/Fnr family transcriptional regulator [Candidatus Solibacter sp.]